MVTLAPYVSIGGLELTGEDASGVLWVADPLKGWAGTASSVAVVQRTRGHGAWTSDGFRQARHIGSTGAIVAPNEAALDAALDRLNAAVSVAGTTLTVREASGDRSCFVKRTDQILAPKITGVYARWSFQVVAADPRKFGPALTASTGLPSSTGGLTFPHTFPHTFDAVTVTGQVSLVNPGNVAGPVRLRIDGPVTAPVVTHVSSGRSLVFSSSLVLGAGQWVEVDMDRREVLENGQSSRNGWVTGRGWSAFEPGANTWAFTAGTYDAGSLLTVYASPAWE